MSASAFPSRPVSEKIVNFVIWDGMGLVAKRIEHAPHSEPPKVIIKSVNPEYDTYERDAAEVHVIGRVVWAARRL